jgi:hypothetical protein
MVSESSVVNTLYLPMRTSRPSLVSMTKNRRRARGHREVNGKTVPSKYDTRSGYPTFVWKSPFLTRVARKPTSAIRGVSSLMTGGEIRAPHDRVFMSL